MWQILALRYGSHEQRPAQANHLMPLPDPHELMPLDYFVWLLRGPKGQRILVDTGFHPEVAAKRNRPLMRPVEDCLRAVGTDPAEISDVVITHLHYDHAGNLDLFPNARFHIQDREVAFATGRHMCGTCLRSTFEVEDVVRLIRAVYADRVQFHDGEGEVTPGVTLHGVGGHSDGMQMVRVETERGGVVLASDVSHFYANMQSGNPFPILYDLGAMVQGWRRARKLAGGDESLVIPGHDPLVRARYPVAEEDPEAWRLDLPPKG